MHDYPHPGARLWPGVKLFHSIPSQKLKIVPYQKDLSLTSFPHVTIEDLTDFINDDEHKGPLKVERGKTWRERAGIVALFLLEFFVRVGIIMVHWGVAGLHQAL